jgi:hypothetical protein
MQADLQIPLSILRLIVVCFSFLLPFTSFSIRSRCGGGKVAITRWPLKVRWWEEVSQVRVL